MPAYHPIQVVHGEKRCVYLVVVGFVVQERACKVLHACYLPSDRMEGLRDSSILALDRTQMLRLLQLEVVSTSASFPHALCDRHG
jgi:hypothetical protein